MDTPPPPFNGDEFKRYMEAIGIEWKTSTSLWPQANGNAESIMKPMGKVMKTATLEGTLPELTLRRRL